MTNAALAQMPCDGEVFSSISPFEASPLINLELTDLTRITRQIHKDPPISASLVLIL